MKLMIYPKMEFAAHRRKAILRKAETSLSMYQDGIKFERVTIQDVTIKMKFNNPGEKK